MMAIRGGGGFEGVKMKENKHGGVLNKRFQKTKSIL